MKVTYQHTKSRVNIKNLARQQTKTEVSVALKCEHTATNVLTNIN